MQKIGQIIGKIGNQSITGNQLKEIIKQQRICLQSCNNIKAKHRPKNYTAVEIPAVWTLVEYMQKGAEGLHFQRAEEEEIAA